MRSWSTLPGSSYEMRVAEKYRIKWINHKRSDKARVNEHIYIIRARVKDRALTLYVGCSVSDKRRSAVHIRPYSRFEFVWHLDRVGAITAEIGFIYYQPCSFKALEAEEARFIRTFKPCLNYQRHGTTGWDETARRGIAGLVDFLYDSGVSLRAITGEGFEALGQGNGVGRGEA